MSQCWRKIILIRVQSSLISAAPGGWFLTINLRHNRSAKKKANQQQLAATAILTVHVLAQALLGSCHLLGRMPQLPTNEQVPDPNTFMAVKTFHASSISHLFRNLKLWGFKAVQIWSSACLVTGWTFFSIFGMPTSLKTNSAHSCKFFGLCANNLNTIILFGKPHKLQSVSHQK